MQFMSYCLKTAFGTDERCKMEDRKQHVEQDQEPQAIEDSHVTNVLAEHTERKIEHMSEATERLSRLSPAPNLTEALRQITER